MHVNEAGVGMIAGGFALRDERFRLLVGKTLIDDVEDLPFGHRGVFQAADLRAGQCGQALNAAVNDCLDGGIRQADEFQRDGFAAEDVDLIGLRHLQDFRIAVPCAREVHGTFTVGEFMIVRAGGFQQREAKVIGSSGAF